MVGVLGGVPLLGTVDAALSCYNDTTGQPVCIGTTSSGAFAGITLVVLAIYLVFVVIGIIAAVKVVTKAGYSGWWVLITIVPLVGFVFILIFAFSTWPATRELEMLRAQVHGGGYRPGGYGGGYNAGPGGGQGPDPLGPRPTSEVVAQEAVIPSFDQVLRSQVDQAGPEPAPAQSAPTPPVAEPVASPTGSTPEPTQPDQPVAGWYPAPGGPPGQLRYWDGTAWTEHLH